VCVSLGPEARLRVLRLYYSCVRVLCKKSGACGSHGVGSPWHKLIRFEKQLPPHTHTTVGFRLCTHKLMRNGMKIVAYPLCLLCDSKIVFFYEIVLARVKV
jgi:hypothetical protein